jgi:hypothetical protein
MSGEPGTRGGIPAGGGVPRFGAPLPPYAPRLGDWTGFEKRESALRADRKGERGV